MCTVRKHASILILLGSILFLVCCDLQGQTPGRTASLSDNAATNYRGNRAKSKKLFISFERSVCLGTCPAYTVRIMADGSLKYVGKSYVRTVGPVSTKLTNRQLLELRSAIRKANYFSFRRSYETVRWL